MAVQRDPLRDKGLVRPYWRKQIGIWVSMVSWFCGLGETQLEETDFTARYIFLLTGGYCTFLIRYTFLVRLCFWQFHISAGMKLSFFCTLGETMAIEWPTCQRIPLLSAFQPEISCRNPAQISLLRKQEKWRHRYDACDWKWKVWERVQKERLRPGRLFWNTK